MTKKAKAHEGFLVALHCVALGMTTKSGNADVRMRMPGN